MYGFIQLKYVSPVTDYIFNANKKYQLVLYNQGVGKMVITKVDITNIDNITKEIRGYAINKSVKNTTGSPFYVVKLFEIDGDKLKLLFTKDFNLQHIDYHSRFSLEMLSPTSVLGEPRTAFLIDDRSYLNEQFFNFDTFKQNSSCILFITLTRSNSLPCITNVLINYEYDNLIYVYDRYHNAVIKEMMPLGRSVPENMINFAAKYCTNGNYTDFVKTFQIDVNVFKPADGSFQKLYNREMKQQYRPFKYDPYLNNLLTSAVDGRLRPFKINKSLTFKMYNKSINVSEFQTDFDLIDGGNGYVCRMNPRDYPRVHMPYKGFMKEIMIFDNIASDTYMIAFKFDSNYYIPPDVHEREYISVLYGNNINMSRFFPELVDVQPDTHLIFYVIMYGLKNQDSIRFVNQKLTDLKQQLKMNEVTRIKPTWYEQGEELATFICGGGYVITMFNRQIDFIEEIKKYSMEPKPIEVYTHTRDIVGAML